MSLERGHQPGFVHVIDFRKVNSLICSKPDQHNMQNIGAVTQAGLCDAKGPAWGVNIRAERYSQVDARLDPFGTNLGQISKIPHANGAIRSLCTRKITSQCQTQNWTLTLKDGSTFG